MARPKLYEVYEVTGAIEMPLSVGGKRHIEARDAVDALSQAFLTDRLTMKHGHWEGTDFVTVVVFRGEREERTFAARRVRRPNP